MAVASKVARRYFEFTNDIVDRKPQRLEATSYIRLNRCDWKLCPSQFCWARALQRAIESQKKHQRRTLETIPLKPERKAQLEEYAKRRGQDPETALDEALATYLEWERQDFAQTV